MRSGETQNLPSNMSEREREWKEYLEKLSQMLWTQRRSQWKDAP
jgi:hypothetical protein